MQSLSNSDWVGKTVIGWAQPTPAIPGAGPVTYSYFSLNEL